MSSFALGENLLILDGNNLKENPWEELEQAQDFLGLQRELTRTNFVYQEKKGFYCYRRLGENRKVRCLAPDKGRQIEEQRAEVINALTDFFRPYNKLLFGMLRRMFQWKM